MKHIKKLFIILNLLANIPNNTLPRCCFAKGDLCPNWKVVYIDKRGNIISIGLEDEHGNKRGVKYDGRGSMLCSDCGNALEDHVLNKENFREGFRIKYK